MAPRYTFSQLREKVNVQKSYLRSVTFALGKAKQRQEQIFRRGGLASEVKTAIDTALADLQETIGGVVTNLTLFRATSSTVAWARVLKSGGAGDITLERNFHHFDIDVDGGAAAAKLTYKTIENATVTLTLAPFIAGDLVIISNSSDPSQNGLYSVSACTTTILTLNETLPGSDNSSEETMIITLKDE